jgi:ribosomal protein S18 acetylase RimI-like enzyme
MKIDIKQASAEDAQLLSDMGARMFNASFGPFNRPEDMRAYLEKSFKEEVISADLRSKNTKYLLVSLTEQAIGYAKVCLSQAPDSVPGRNPVELARIYIDLAYSSRGYGSQLVEACLEAARRLEGDTLWLGVWERNEAAIRFYRRWGFKIVGTMEFVLGDDM